MYEKLKKEQLEPDERILWEKKPKVELPFGRNGLIVSSVIAIFFIGLKFFGFIDYSHFWLALCFSPLLWFIAISAYLESRKYLYIATDRRVLVFSTFGIDFKWYKDIYGMEESRAKIVFYDVPMHKVNKEHVKLYLNFSYLEDSSTDFNGIYDIYVKKSPSTQVRKKVERLARNHGFSLKEQKQEQNTRLILEGVDNGLAIKYITDAGTPLFGISIRITIPNAKNRFLSITRETIMDNFGKLLGTQDIIVNDSNFDPTFLLQADDSAYLKKVLTKEVKAALLKLDNLHPGKFQLGEKQEEPTKVGLVKDSADVLDLHLLERNATTEIVEATEKPPILNYEAKFYSHHTESVDFLLKIIDQSLETSLALAKEIDKNR